MEEITDLRNPIIRVFFKSRSDVKGNPSQPAMATEEESRLQFLQNCIDSFEVTIGLGLSIQASVTLKIPFDIFLERVTLKDFLIGNLMYIELGYADVSVTAKFPFMVQAPRLTFKDMVEVILDGVGWGFGFHLLRSGVNKDNVTPAEVLREIFGENIVDDNASNMYKSVKMTVMQGNNESDFALVQRILSDTNDVIIYNNALNKFEVISRDKLIVRSPKWYLRYRGNRIRISPQGGENGIIAIDDFSVDYEGFMFVAPAAYAVESVDIHKKNVKEVVDRITIEDVMRSKEVGVGTELYTTDEVVEGNAPLNPNPKDEKLLVPVLPTVVHLSDGFGSELMKEYGSSIVSYHQYPVTMTVNCVGVPWIMPGDVVMFDGTGGFGIDGVYYVEEITHSGGSDGFTTSLKLRTIFSEVGKVVSPSVPRETSSVEVKPTEVK